VYEAHVDVDSPRVGELAQAVARDEELGGLPEPMPPMNQV
jgi:hypothetical protein